MLLEGKGLRKVYGSDENQVVAIDDIDLTIEEGSFVAIIGRSGSGKSTLLHMLSGLCEPTKGQVVFQGTSLYELKDDARTRLRRRHMGFVFQFFNLISILNVQENIALPIHLDHAHLDDAYVDDLLRLLGLEDKRSASVAALSGGEQQRVAIARALASKPAIIFADEPTGNLDDKSSHEVVSLLRVAQRRYHETVVMVTHDEAIAEVADRIITIADGKIIRDIKKTTENTKGVIV